MLAAVSVAPLAPCRVKTKLSYFLGPGLCWHVINWCENNYQMSMSHMEDIRTSASQWGTFKPFRPQRQWEIHNLACPKHEKQDWKYVSDGSILSKRLHACLQNLWVEGAETFKGHPWQHKMTTHVLFVREAFQRLQSRRGEEKPATSVTKLESDPPLRRRQSGRRIDGLTAEERAAQQIGSGTSLFVPPRRSVDMFHIRGEQCVFSSTYCNLFGHLGEKPGGAWAERDSPELRVSVTEGPLCFSMSVRKA